MLKEAIAVAEQVLAIERQIFREDKAELIGTQEWLSNQYLTQRDSKRAEERAYELLQVQTALHGNDGWRTVSARWWLDYLQKLAEAEPETLAKMLAIEAEYNRICAAQKIRRGRGEDSGTAAIERTRPRE